MLEETKQKLIKYNEEQNYGTADGDLIETVTEASSVWEGEQDRHRWYSMIPTVVKVGDMFLEYHRCDVHGEMSSVEDCIGSYKLEDIVEVFPVEVQTVAYKTKEQIEKMK